MARVAPTRADLKARFPKFAGVDDAIIDAALAEAARLVDDSWPEADYAPGRLLYAAHVLTLDGFGEGTEAQLNAEGVGDFQSIRLGSLSLSRFSKDAATQTGSATLDVWNSTTYGKRFYALALTAVGAGPISTGDKTTLAAHPNARDVSRLPGLGARWPGNG